MAEVVHRCPEPGYGGLTLCCRRTPLELPRSDRLTIDASLVTCPVRLISDRGRIPSILRCPSRGGPPDDNRCIRFRWHPGWHRGVAVIKYVPADLGGSDA